ncbi:nucleoside monophosphate kinase [Patescibacteria group bacterium]|nr:nucleoside monophosphate kinase [Patescibacteria group bacterium]
MDLVFFGIQGSGKGTQAKKLAAEFGYDIFEAGGELRKIKASGTPLGDEVASFIDEGKLVPFEIIMLVTKEAVLARGADQKILFDGIPRDSDQMNAFNKIMKEVGRDFKCIEIKLGKEEAVQRILGRAEEEGRADDSDESIILRRMDTFIEKTMPVIEEYKDQGKLIEVNGDGTIDQIYEGLKEALHLE